MFYMYNIYINKHMNISAINFINVNIEDVFSLLMLLLLLMVMARDIVVHVNNVVVVDRWLLLVVVVTGNSGSCDSFCLLFFCVYNS